MTLEPAASAVTAQHSLQPPASRVSCVSNEVVCKALRRFQVDRVLHHLIERGNGTGVGFIIPLGHNES